MRAGVGLDDEALRAVGDLAGKLRVEDLRQSGWNVAGPRKEGDGLSWVRASKPFSSPEQAGRVMAELSGPSERETQGPSGPSERETQGPSGPSERETQGPSGPSERETQGPSGPSERETQGPSGPSERETQGPSGPSERETQGPSGPSERETQGPSGPSERETQGPSGPSERETQGPSGPSERETRGPFGDMRLSQDRSFFHTGTGFSGTVDLSGGLSGFIDADLQEGLGDGLGLDLEALRQRFGPSLADAFRIEVVARLPGSIHSNAASTVRGGVKWVVEPGQSMRLEAGARTFNLVPWAPALVALAAAAGAVAVAVVLVRRRRP